MFAWLIACQRTDPADLVLDGGTVHIDVDTTTDALAIRDGVVVAIGDAARELIDDNTTVNDLAGAHVYPGFQDNHVHLLAGSFAFDRLLLLGTPSMAALASKVSNYAPTAPDEPWIVGYGWLGESIPEPDGRPITAILPDRPALLVSNSGHEAIVNQKALDLAGITRDTPDPVGGQIARDEDGNPTGYLVETAVELVSDLVLQAYDDERLGGGLAQRFDEFSSSGITGVSEILASPGFAIGRPWIYADRETAGTLPLRVTYYMPIFKPSDVAVIAAARSDYDGELVRFGGGKVWVDGSMGSAEAWVEEPYLNSDGDVGSHYFSAEDLTAIIAATEEEKMPLKLHVNGDAAIDAALTAMETVAAANGGLDQRYIFEHAVLPDDADYARMQTLGVIASVQPTHYIAASFGDTADALGERFDHAYDFAGFKTAGIPMANGTDWPVWPSQQPLLVSWNASVADPPHNLSLRDALEAYTVGTARAIGREDELGRLAEGYLADFVVLGADPQAVDSADVSSIEIRQVWVAGRQVK